MNARKEELHFEKMISFDNVLWHQHCGVKVERTKLDRVSTHVGGRANPDLSQVRVNKKYQIINLCLPRPKKSIGSCQTYIGIPYTYAR